MTGIIVVRLFFVFSFGDTENENQSSAPGNTNKVRKKVRYNAPDEDMKLLKVSLKVVIEKEKGRISKRWLQVNKIR